MAGDYTPHPNSLLFNAFPGFWPFKMFWFFRKVSSCKLVTSLFFDAVGRDFPVERLPRATRESPRRRKTSTLL